MRRARLTASLRQLEDADLHHHRSSLENEDAANEREQKLLLCQDRDSSERTTDRQGTDVSHKHFGRRRVVPEESETRSNHRTAEHRQLPTTTG
jgi:hypothetical protein